MLNIKFFQRNKYNFSRRQTKHMNSPREIFWKLVWDELKDGVIASTKGAVLVDSMGRAGAGTMKAVIDFSRGDAVCGGLCCLSVGCETASGILVWCPIPGKVSTLAVLKGTSIGAQRFRDMCSSNPPSSFC